MKKKLISIIVPIFNSELYLDKCLQSLVNQTLKDIEIVLINDGSTDSSQKIIDKYKKKYSNIVSHTIKNNGQANARNIAIKEAHGEYLMFVDSDDWLSLDACQKLYSASNETYYDIVVGSFSKVIDNMIIEESKIEKIDDPIKKFITTQSGPCYKIVRRNLIIDNNLFFPIIKAYEDISVVPAWSLFSNEIKYIDDSIYYYLIREGSTMNQINYNKKLECIFESLDCLKQKFIEAKKYDEYCLELEWIYIEHLLHAASLRFFKFDNYQSNLVKINNIMKNNFPKWKNNNYYKQQNIKYKIICRLFYQKRYVLLKKLLRKGRR